MRRRGRVPRARERYLCVCTCNYLVICVECGMFTLCIIQLYGFNQTTIPFGVNIWGGEGRCFYFHVIFNRVLAHINFQENENLGNVINYNLGGSVMYILVARVFFNDCSFENNNIISYNILPNISYYKKMAVVRNNNNITCTCYCYFLWRRIIYKHIRLKPHNNRF